MLLTSETHSEVKHHLNTKPVVRRFCRPSAYAMLGERFYTPIWSEFWHYLDIPGGPERKKWQKKMNGGKQKIGTKWRRQKLANERKRRIRFAGAKKFRRRDSNPSRLGACLM